MAAEMWPLKLDMTRDECRGILRRSELETYSSVISTFRAQGGLNEPKARILEELREIFHISVERHKAEARRVANDERLCTVAEMISGPNTEQEWSKEGHRNFPMLSRAVPHTGLSVIANNAQTVVSLANSLLPLPEQTNREVTHDQFPVSNQPPIVLEDPLKALMARPPLLKRAHLNSESNSDKLAGTPSGPLKKRLTEIVPINHTNMRIQQLYHTHSQPSNPPLFSSAPVQRKNTSQKRATKTTPKPRVPKQKPTAQSNRTPKAPNPSMSQQSQSSMAYASSLKSKKLSFPSENKSLLGETFPELPLSWPPFYPPTSAQNDGNKFDQIIQQHEPTFSSAITPSSPVQVVFTSHVDLPTSDQPKYQSYPNNLITESTPIQWVEDSPSQPILQAPTILPPTMIPPTLTPLNANRPIKMAVPAATKKNAPSPRAPTAKQTKAIRRKVVPEPQPPFIKNPPLPTSFVSNIPYQSLPPLAPTNIDPNSMQISSITNKLPTISNLNLINATTKLPTQIMQTTNVLPPTKKQPTITNTIGPASSATLIPLTGSKPKIQVTQHIIIPKTHTPFQSKGNVKLVQSANGSIMLKGANDLVLPTTPVSMASAPLTPVHSFGSIATSNTKPNFPKIQLVKKNNSNMILMQKVTSPFGGQATANAIKDGRPIKFNIVQNKSVASGAQHIVCDLAGKTPPKSNTTINLNNIKITEDTPVDILPGNENMIIEVGSTSTIGQPPVPQQQILGPNHIILDANMKKIASASNTPTTPATISNTVSNQKMKPIKIAGASLGSDLMATVAKGTTSAAAMTISPKPDLKAITALAANAVLMPTDWEAALDQHQSKHDSATTAESGSNATGFIEEDGSGTDTIIMRGYVTSEETNEDDIIQYEGDSTDYQDEMSLDGVPDTTTKTPPISTLTPAAVRPTVDLVKLNLVASTNCKGGALSGATIIKPGAGMTEGGSHDGDDEDTQDGESMMMQMQEFDENGCSQIRNVSLEELVDSGHIILDDS